jgi:hypothetical protein
VQLRLHPSFFLNHSIYEGFLKYQLLRCFLFTEFLKTVWIMLVMGHKNFRSCRWGSSLTVCARLTVHSSPHRNERTFSGARVCRITFKHLPQPLRSHIFSFGTIGKDFKIPPFSAQKTHSAGGRGGPCIFFWVGILIFFYLGAHAKFGNPTTTLSWRFSR